MQKILAIAFSICALSIHYDAQARKNREAEAEATAPVVDCTGPKKRLAVLSFGGVGKYGSYEGWDVGEAVAAQLATALEQTDCFVLTDRLALSDVLREQELGLAGVVSRESAAPAGGLIGAQILVKGEITEFEPGKQGRGMTGGFALGDSPIGIRLGGNRNTVHLAADIRLIDASTGEVLFTQRVDSEAKTFGLAFGLDYEDASLGSDNFNKTPLGLAVRDAVIEAAGFIVGQTREIQWTGRIVFEEDGSVFVNAGADSGVRAGDTFVVSTVERELIDPSSGISLGRIEKQLGRVRVEQVEGKYSVAKMLGDFPIRRGDVVRAADEIGLGAAEAGVPDAPRTARASAR